MSNPSHSDIMRKLKEIKGIKELLEKAVLLYVLLTDGDLPVWCYALIIGALAYLVNPFDAVRVFNILCQPIIGQYDHPICRGNGSIAVTASDSSSVWGASSVLMPATYRRITA
jgi:hypothetical protein